MTYKVIAGRLVKVLNRPRNMKSPEFQPVPNEAPPNPKDKGVFGKNCNRQVCQKPGAFWWNIGSQRYYCEACATLINDGARLFKEEILCFHKTEAVK